MSGHPARGTERGTVENGLTTATASDEEGKLWPGAICWTGRGEHGEHEHEQEKKGLAAYLGPHDRSRHGDCLDTGPTMAGQRVRGRRDGSDGLQSSWSLWGPTSSACWPVTGLEREKDRRSGAVNEER